MHLPQGCQQSARHLQERSLLNMIMSKIIILLAENMKLNLKTRKQQLTLKRIKFHFRILTYTSLTP
jgi:hypothetical protein